MPFLEAVAAPDPAEAVAAPDPAEAASVNAAVQDIQLSLEEALKALPVVNDYDYDL